MKLFDHSSHSHEACPVHDLSEDSATPIFGSLTFYQFDKILGGACTAFACLVILIHVMSHAFHFSNRGEQAKIMRIAMLIPVYSIFSFLSIYYPQAKVYLLPWLDLFQANSMAAFFLLLSDYISPHSEQRDLFFAAMTIPEKPKDGKEGESGLTWYRKRWLLIFQYPVVSLIVAIATDITQAADIYCQYLTKPYYAKLWLNIAHYVSLGLAVVSILKFALQTKSRLANHKPMMKLVSFKVIVILTFVQTIVFWILQATGALKPTSTLTYADLNMGIPSLLSCIEMVPISVFIAWAYPVRPYIIRKGGDHAEYGSATNRHQGESYQGGFLGIKAILSMWSPMETLKAIAFAFKLLTMQKGGGRNGSGANDGGQYYGDGGQYYGSGGQYGPQQQRRRARR